jgi:hypothetical protein
MTDPLDIWILSDGKPGHENQSFGLADLLADERYKLYECFDRKGLLDLLDRLRESGMEMLACAP